MTMYILNVHVC